MRLGHVIGKVTLSRQEDSYRGGRFLLVRPAFAEPSAVVPLGGTSADVPLSGTMADKMADKTAGGPATLVVYDNLGAGVGHLIGYVEGSEAAVPFAEPTPVDAYNAAIADEVFHQPPK